MKLIGSLAFAIAFLLPALPAHCQDVQSKPFVISADQDEKTFAGKWVWLIYTEAFKRLGLRIELVANPMTRQSLLADEGLIDAEAARVHGYGADHPNLIRVEESILDLAFSLYTADPALRIQKIDDLAAMNLRGEYRRGVGICEKAFKQLFPPERLSDVTKTDQGAKKLLAGRTDVYCDNEVSMVRIYHSGDISDVAKIRKLISMGVIPTYPYLHKKHAQLAPRLAETLKKMKAEGLIEKYRAQAERDMGWTK